MDQVQRELDPFYQAVQDASSPDEELVAWNSVMKQLNLRLRRHPELAEQLAQAEKARAQAVLDNPNATEQEKARADRALEAAQAQIVALTQRDAGTPPKPPRVRPSHGPSQLLVLSLTRRCRTSCSSPGPACGC